MQRRHFQLIANVVRKHGGDRKELLAAAFAAVLSNENGQFNRAKFVDACGVPDA